MKKQGIFVLLLVTCLFFGFVCGFFLGRNLYHGDVHISALPKATTQPDIPTASSDPTVQTDPIQTTAPSSAPGKININTATKQQLMTLPGIGEKIAMSIIEYRETNGPFRSAAELLNVDLIGEKRLEAIIELITF
jgi:competence ComEA-like helix-hairpin-helix protein